MTTKPYIGISGSHKIDNGGSFPGYKRAFANDDYIRAIIAAGGIPVILPFTENDDVARALLARVDALLLTGGHDVYPLNYGEEPLQGIEDVWPERDHFDMILLSEAQRRELPIMGICRGHQIINVFHGGTLYQDLSYDTNCTLKHSQNQTPELPTHSIRIDADSRLARILGTTETVVNSHHHQTVKRVGDGLTVTATAKDGTIEAMESTVYPYLQTYQFHPEMMAHRYESAARIFRDFIEYTAQRQ